MSDRWDFYSLRVDDEPASIFLDMGIADEAPISAYAIRGCVRVSMLRPRADGLSSQEEFNDLVALEDHVTPLIGARNKALYVGRNTSGGYRDFYFYTGDAAAFETAATEAMISYPTYGFELHTSPDPEWRAYFDFLYPPPLSRQQMANRALQDALSDQGDDLDEPRPIDHLLLSTEAGKLEELAALLRTQGYLVSNRRTYDDDGVFALEFQRVDKPSEMQDVALGLYQMATLHGADYDGWGCETVKGPQPTSARGRALGKWFKGLLR